MDGVMLDKNMADKWLMNQDQICPKVIVDDDDDYDEEEESSDDDEDNVDDEDFNEKSI